MKCKHEKGTIICSVIFCALAMSFVDGVLQPAYMVKSILKVILFLLVPMVYFHRNQKDWKQLRVLLIPKRKDFILALLLGIGVFAVILGGYWILSRYYDISGLVLKLTSNAGVDAGNFVAVSLYISLVNSLLEEFFFRGYAFITLKTVSSRKFAYLFSAGWFALYHYGMMAAGNLWISLLALVGLFIAGCFFDLLNERSGNIITSWLVHMFANFAINTIGFRIFGII